jgi:hypothetical protein
VDAHTYKRFCGLVQDLNQPVDFVAVLHFEMKIELSALLIELVKIEAY